MNASKPSTQSKGLVGTLAVGTKALHGIKRVPQCSHLESTEQYNKIGEKPIVILYTNS